MEETPKLGSDLADELAAHAAQLTTLTLLGGMACFMLALAVGRLDALNDILNATWWLIVAANALAWAYAFTIDWRVQRDLFGTTEAEVRAYYAHTERALKRAS